VLFVLDLMKRRKKRGGNFRYISQIPPKIQKEIEIIANRQKYKLFETIFHPNPNIPIA
jgi:hypothetical protein